jgi:protein-disulfide isomerase
VEEQPLNRGPAEGDVLATIDGDALTMTDVKEVAGGQLGQLDYQYNLQRHQLIEAALERALRERLLELDAEAKGITKDELIVSLTAGNLEISEEEVVNFYRQNMARLAGRRLEDISGQIEDYLRETRYEQILDAHARSLRGERDVEVLFGPFRVDLDTEGAPVFGSSSAPITLVEFSDFECPYCGRFFNTLETVKENYGDQLRVIYMQFPLVEIHPMAFKAAEASLCAHEQGRFWEMHDLLFTEQDRLDVESLKEKAGRLGLDQAKFDFCLDSGAFAERVRSDQQEGNRLGVTGTPALFLNGIPVEGGAVPYTALAQMIDDELERLGSN